jgi:hypothetical protein
MGTDEFRTELEALINRHSMERGSQTPDFILAKYMLKCLTNFDEASVERDTWYGRQSNGEPFPKDPTPPTPIDDDDDDACTVTVTVGGPDRWKAGDVLGDYPLPIKGYGGGGGGASGSPTVAKGGNGDAFSSDGQFGGGGAGGAASSVRGPSIPETVQGPIPGGAGGNAGGAQGPSIPDPLTTSEESDWRTFAFARTQEGIVWERASVQRIFATLDAQRAARLECERQLRASRDQRDASLKDADALRSERDAATDKWHEYERDYILPCFQWAKELGIDLEQMVLDNPGRNCVEILVSTLRRDRSACVSGG